MLLRFPNLTKKTTSILFSTATPPPLSPSPSHFLSLLQQSPSSALTLLELLRPSPILLWNLLIRHSVHRRHLSAAFSLSLRLRHAGARPDQFTFPFVLKACGELPSRRRGTLAHALALTAGFDSNVFVSNALITMYSRCDVVEDARQVFDEMTERGIDDVVSWNSIVGGYVKGGSFRLALKVFGEMGNGVCRRRPDVTSLVNVFPACAGLRDSSRAREIHGYAARNDLFRDVFVANAAVDAYAKCGMMGDALKVFRGMEKRDVVSWNSMVTGYSQNGRFDEAFELFDEMRRQKFELNVVTWSSVIAGYAQHGYGHEALHVFRQMQLSGSKPNSITIISLLSACASVGSLSHGMEVHAYALRTNLIGGEEEEDLMVQNGLIDMYSKCKCFNSAHLIFNPIPMSKRNVVTWTALIGGHAQHGDPNYALELLSTMSNSKNASFSPSPNLFTISCALMACARLSALRFGREIHARVFRGAAATGTPPFVDNCLIDMYSKCGHMAAAHRVFLKTPQKNRISFTSLMAGYAMHGRGEEAFSIFKEMQKSHLSPDSITFLVLLHACSHAGMVEEGLECFEAMADEHELAPASEHYACLVDLLGRAGRLAEAWEKITQMPTEPSPVVWAALLSASRTHSNVELAELAFQKLSDLGSINDGIFTLLSNVYANAGLWGKVGKIRVLMRDSGIKKRAGVSWIVGEKGNVKAFFVGDRAHEEAEEIYEVLGMLMEECESVFL